MNKFYSFLILFSITFGFVGCTKQPILKIYTLDTPTTKKVATSQHKTKTFKVMYPQSLKSAISSKILFSYSLNEQGSYENAQWSNSIAKLLEGTFIQTLEQSKMFKAVIAYTSTANEDYRLESNIFELSHQVRGNDSHSVVSIQFSLVHARKSVLIATKRFSYIVPTKTTNAKGYVDATNEAIHKMNSDLVEWIKGVRF